jgi:YD repeat-containing protein
MGGVPLLAVFDRPKAVALAWDRQGRVTEWNATFDEERQWSYRDFLALLAAEEVAHRQQTRIARLKAERVGWARVGLH